MTGDTEWDPHLFLLAVVRIKEEDKGHKIYEISRSPKVRGLKTDIIMCGIGDVLMIQVMIERIVSFINVWCVNVNAMESKTRHSVIPPEEFSQEFDIGIKRRRTRWWWQQKMVLAMQYIHCAVDIRWIICILTESASMRSYILTTYWPRLSIRKETRESGFIPLGSLLWPIHTQNIQK